MSGYVEEQWPDEQKKKDCDYSIIEQLRGLAKKGYKMPWIKEDGVAPFQKLILRELIKKIKVPGSINCRDELEKGFKLDIDKIKATASEILPRNEPLGTYNFCKVAIKTLEKDILYYVGNDTEWAERLLARYVVCTLRDRYCHAETVNDLLTVTYKAEEAFPAEPESRIIFLMSVIKAWKSGLLCGVMEECLSVQDKFIGRLKPVCKVYDDTIDKMSCTYFSIRGIMSRLSALNNEVADNELKDSINNLQSMCDELLGAIKKSTPIYDSGHEEKAA